MIVLGIETSCDETAAAVVESGRSILSNVVQTQFDLHGRFGGVVPELASRRHVEVITMVVGEALRQAGVKLHFLDGLAVTQGPGLVGSLLVGLNMAKAISYVTGLPLAGVNHLEAHVAAGFMGGDLPEFPLAALVVSGGHTNLYLVKGPMSFELYGQTRDDAAGEAFDKVAQLLGLGFPGGAAIETAANLGDPERFPFPRPMLGEGLDFSFSGLKTAVLNLVNSEFPDRQLNSRDLSDVAASFQAAVVDVLAGKTKTLLRQLKVKGLILAGGVAANQRLRKEMALVAEDMDLPFIVPNVEFCTDNGAMLACLGYHHLSAGYRLNFSADAYSRVPTTPSG
ncbi:MAG: tRNA (adenosine(37)-N6)-threonylcarbamoyltransferase complex transferase subunit TsaD [Deltaproteobacteria bacterium]|nr:tRNA (adenosine(37)-N6)-threonylcarbamoyltransferase complex transferase subunit TsaD [Deltaproteobacteria bacterium]